MKTTPQGRKITLVLLVVLVMLLFILSGLAYFRIDLRAFMPPSNVL